MGGTPTIDFSKYSAAPSIDFSKYTDATPTAGSPAAWDALKDKYGLPHEIDLSKNLFSQPIDINKIDIGKFSQAYNEANQQAPTPTSFLGRSWDEAKNLVRGAFGEGALTGPIVGGPGPIATSSVAGTTLPNPSGIVQLAKQRGAEIREHPAAAAGAATTDVAALFAPFVPELGGKIWSKVSPAATVEEALGRKLSIPEADAPRPGGQIQPALNNTPREVLQHASDEGIKLTPGQATEDAMAQNLQKAGTTAAVGGKELTSALQEQRIKFGQAVNGFMDDVDPKRAGLSAESAGEQIKQTQQVAKSVSHDNAAQGYAKIDYLMDKPVNAAPISQAWNQVKANLPVGAEESILAQTPRSMRAVVSDMLSGKPEGFKPTFSQGIQLRKFFRDLGDTEGLPNQTQAMFKQMSSVVDKAMETSAGANSDDWRAANAGWKDYATKYGDPQSILYKIGRTQDPQRVTTMLTNASAADINILKAEKMDAALEPLKRQVVQDIAQSRFRVAHDGLGGYSDSYLKALFSPEEVKELYLKGDLANRLQYDPNPSGTGSNISSLSQLGLWNQTKMSAAAKLSMPKDALSFLPTGQKSLPGRSSLTPLITLQQPTTRKEAVNQ
jgi:hypothetical protein